MIKKAFTMFEFLIVLLVIGILSVAIIPRINDTTLDEKVIKFISHVKYTQHLAMVYDAYDPTDATWYKKSYCMDLINNNEWKINRGLAGGSFLNAIDPLDKSKPIHVKLNTITFNITSTKQFTRLCFDHLGRTMINNIKIDSTNMIYDKIMIDFTNGTDIRRVFIEPETGYVHQ